MAGPAPKTDSWTALENRHGKLGVFLIVGGCVHVTNTNQTPYLKEAAPSGINPRILILDLSIRTEGAGVDVLVRKHASYRKKVKADQYASVDIRWDGKSMATCKVLDDGEHNQHLAAITQAANAAHPARKAKTAAKKKVAKAKPKGAAKKTGAKKAAPKRKSATSSKSKRRAGASRAKKARTAAGRKKKR